MVSIAFVPPTPGSGSTVNTADVTFFYQLSDFENGVGNIEFSLDGVEFNSVLEGTGSEDWNSNEIFPTIGSFTLTFVHGIFTIRFRVIDRLDNIGPVTLHELNVDIFTNISIDPPPAITNNPSLTVTGTREAGASVTVTNNGTSLGAADLPAATTWSIMVVLEQGANVIEATATDLQSNQATATATVTLDTTEPGVPVITEVDPSIAEFTEDLGPVDTNVVNQTIIGEKEAGTAIFLNDVEEVSLNNSTNFSILVTLTAGTNEFRLKTKDAADNESPEVVVTLVLDITPPESPSIVINDGLEFTLVRDVTLELSATDAVEVKVSEDPDFPEASFVSFVDDPTLLPFELSRGGGEKTVFAVFRDGVGNETIPVFDTIVLPSTISEPISQPDDMIVQELQVTPEEEYLIRLEDNKDGTFSVDLYLDFQDALDQVDRVGFATSTTEGPQMLSLTPDGGGIDPGGTIIVTLVRGAALVIYRFRTDVLDAGEGELGAPIVYQIAGPTNPHHDAQVRVPIFEGSAFGRVLEAFVDGDATKLRITKSFTLVDESTAIVDQEYFPVIDEDGPSFPIDGAKFDYPLLPVAAEVLEIEEEADAYLITIDRDLDRFDATFGYEMLFTKRDDLVTDYRIFQDGRVEFLNESGLASGNVRITYNSPSIITSTPSSEFRAIDATIGSTVTLSVEPTNNLILLSDFDKVCVRFFHSLVDPLVAAPSFIEVTINNTINATTSAYTVTASNARAEIREFCVDSALLFPSGIGSDAYGATNPVLSRVDVSFTALSDPTYSDELQVLVNADIVSANCRVLVNDEEVFFSPEKVSSKFDFYELRVHNGAVDVVCNDECVYSADLNLNGGTAIFGAGARVAGDQLRATFGEFTTIQYLDATPSVVALPGRFIEIEANIRRGPTSLSLYGSDPLLRSFELDFESERSEFPERVFISDGLVAEFLDTSTVAIIGAGQREEVLLAQGSGEEDEGESIDFSALNESDGRHFQVTSFPIVSGTLRVFLLHNGTELLLSEDVDYHVDLGSGRLSLFHPIALSDRLRVEYTSESDSNQPELFLDLDPLVAKFGTPSLQNTLSLGAQLAFENGAKRVLAVQALDPSLDPDWTAAFEALAKHEAYFVVPIPPSSYPAIVATGLNHVINQSSTPRRHERVLFTGATEDFTSDDIGIFANTFRGTFVEPANVLKVVRGETLFLDGRFLAAAYAGKLSSLSQVSEPGTGKTLVGFDISAEPKLTRIELEKKIRDGIVSIRSTVGGGRVIRSITATQSRSAVEEEQSIVRIRDFLAINIREVLENRFVGRVVTNEILDEVAAETNRFLSAQIARRVISAFQNVAVRVDSQEPRQVNISFDVQPLFPLNELVMTVNAVARIQ